MAGPSLAARTDTAAGDRLGALLRACPPRAKMTPMRARVGLALVLVAGCYDDSAFHALDGLGDSSSSTSGHASGEPATSALTTSTSTTTRPEAAPVGIPIFAPGVADHHRRI